MEITEEQRAAIWSFSGTYGRKWKDELRAYWMTKRQPYGFEDWWTAPLTQLRNTHGPKWLAKYKLQ